MATLIREEGGGKEPDNKEREKSLLGGRGRGGEETEVTRGEREEG